MVGRANQSSTHDSTVSTPADHFCNEPVTVAVGCHKYCDPYYTEKISVLFTLENRYSPYCLILRVTTPLAGMRGAVPSLWPRTWTAETYKLRPCRSVQATNLHHCLRCQEIQ